MAGESASHQRDAVARSRGGPQANWLSYVPGQNMGPWEDAMAVEVEKRSNGQPGEATNRLSFPHETSADRPCIGTIPQVCWGSIRIHHETSRRRTCDGADEVFIMLELPQKWTDIPPLGS